jgi:hypothetical protein
MEDIGNVPDKFTTLQLAPHTPNAFIPKQYPGLWEPP